MKRFLGQFCADTSGATAIEYALIAAGLAVAILGGVTAFSTEIEWVFQRIVEIFESSGA